MSERREKIEKAKPVSVMSGILCWFGKHRMVYEIRGWGYDKDGDPHPNEFWGCRYCGKEG